MPYACGLLTPDTWNLKPSCANVAYIYEQTTRGPIFNYSEIPWRSWAQVLPSAAGGLAGV
jgi:hypothetical protein